MRYKTLWHVTPRENLASILNEGIEPGYSQGKFKRCWFSTWAGLPVTLAHISAIKKTPVDQLVCVRVRVPLNLLKHFNRHVYYSYFNQRDNRVALPGDTALYRWENQRRAWRGMSKRR